MPELIRRRSPDARECWHIYLSMEMVEESLS
jgi:hypothetical protein